MEHLGEPFRDLRSSWWYFKKFVRENCKWTVETFGILQGNRLSDGLADGLDKRLYHDGTDNPAKRGVICICDGEMHHGGLTDRLRGILTAYREAKRVDKKFYIYWNSPFELTDYLEPAGFDWRISKEEISRARGDASVIVVDDMSPFQSLVRLRISLSKETPQIHLYTNADSARGEYRELYTQLFKPTLLLQTEVEKNRQRLGDRYWAFTFRFLQLLGDFNDWSQLTLSDEEASELMDYVKNEFVSFAKKVPDNCKIHVTSDSRRFLDFIEDADERIVIVEGDVKNIDLVKERYVGAWMKTFVDQQLLMGADTVVLMRTGKMYPSGFPRFAAEIGGARFIDYKF